MPLRPTRMRVSSLSLRAPTGLESFCERSKNSFKCTSVFTGWYDPALLDKPGGGKWVIDDWPVESFEVWTFMRHYAVRLRGAAPKVAVNNKRPPLDVVFCSLRTD